MAKLNYGPAKKFLYNCQYLLGVEINVKTRRGTTVTGTVVGFGAIGSIYGKIELWAKVKDNRSGRIMQVELMNLYKTVTRASVTAKAVNGAETPEAVTVAETSAAQ
jgi:hypothetical protein